MSTTSTNTDSKYKYFAFISYKREDEKWAKWLQDRLMHYKIPTKIRKQHPELPTVVHPVFRDSTDLCGGVLADVINEALDSSRYLIVICSPRAAQSLWVCKEVEHFIETGREKEIIPFIIEGEPNSKDTAKECFPEALRKLAGKRELLGINIDENGRTAAAIKVVARMFGLQFDALWQRYEREQRRKKTIALSLSIVGMILAIIIASIMIYQNRKMKINQSRFVAEKSMQLLEEGDSYTAARLSLEAWDLSHTIEAEQALREATAYKCATFKGHMHGVNSVAFSPDGKYIVSAADDKTIKLWDAKSGKIIKTFNGHTDVVNSAAFSPDGNHIVSASMDETIKLWDIEKEVAIRTFSGHSDNVTSAVFSPNGKYIVSASYDNTVKLWEFKPLDELIEQTRERFKDNPLTSEERREYYIE